MSWHGGGEIINGIIKGFNDSEHTDLDLSIFWSVVYDTLEAMDYSDWHNHFGQDDDLDRIMALRACQRAMDDDDFYDESLKYMSKYLNDDDIGLLEAIRKTK